MHHSDSLLSVQITAVLDFEQPLYELPLCKQEPLLLQFATPVRVLQAHSSTQLREVLEEVQEAARAGAYCIGGLSYEAAGALQEGLPTHPPQGPLAFFAVYERPCNVRLPQAQFHDIHWQAGMEQGAFESTCARIHADIAKGRYYQLNLTQQYLGSSDQTLDRLALFAALRQAQPGGYGLFLDMGEQALLSVSPELFFDWHQTARGEGKILARPMKGTAPRGATPEQDEARARQLRDSPKERAENIMIVDLLRNDLGQIAQTGSVRVPRLFHLQALPSLWQMTSDVRATLPAGTQLYDVFRALFPCGSVTGAPKRSSMAAIKELEVQARGWYCGALGLVRSDGAGGIRATFNVPIRTLVAEGSHRLSCGIGSGITASANAQDEWREWAVKRVFFERVSKPFSILETLALDQGQLRHWQLHLERMGRSARHFGFPWDEQAAREELQGLALRHAQGLWRCRLLLHPDGRLEAEAFVCEPVPAMVQLKWAAQPLEDGDFVRHKTTRRAHYEALAPEPESGVFDSLLYNARGEITECTRGNIAALLDGCWITPAASCGLLPGVGRAIALQEGRVREGRLLVSDAPRVEAWAFINSLRGWIPARLQGRPPAFDSQCSWPTEMGLSQGLDDAGAVNHLALRLK